MEFFQIESSIDHGYIIQKQNILLEAQFKVASNVPGYTDQHEAKKKSHSHNGCHGFHDVINDGNINKNGLNHIDSDLCIDYILDLNISTPIDLLFLLYLENLLLYID